MSSDRRAAARILGRASVAIPLPVLLTICGNSSTTGTGDGCNFDCLLEP